MRPDRVRPGQPFVVEVPFGDGARVALVRDRDGSEVAGTQLRAGERSLALVAPARPEPYTVRVTLQRGNGNETLVRPLHFAGSLTQPGCSRCPIRPMTPLGFIDRYPGK